MSEVVKSVHVVSIDVDEAAVELTTGNEVNGTDEVTTPRAVLDEMAELSSVVETERLEVDGETDSGEVTNSSVQVVLTLDADVLEKAVVELKVNEETACVEEATPRAVLLEAAEVFENGRIEVAFATADM